MSPRPRTVDDAAILDAAHRAISSHGPSRFTLADVAREAGLSPATLVQRFGSKRGLLLALAAQGVEYVEECFARVRAAHRSPLRGLIAAATEMPRYTKTAEELANHLAYLQIDLSDPDFYPLMLEHSKRTRAGYRALLQEAVAAGELAPCDTGKLARLVEALVGGSLISWAVYREGSAERWVRDDLEVLLAPHRPTRAGRPKTAPSRSAARTRSRRAVAGRR